ncbi:MAG: hypothetical protein K8R41_06870 [Bacteroidales bacterium]|nr:hypothetical protein [Bacteroidales bacterium]
MKHLEIKQNEQNYPDLFEKDNTEPFLVENSKGNHFLVLPLQQMNWQEIFFQLYQLPSNLFLHKKEVKTNYDNIENLCGSMEGLLSSSNSFAQNKQNEIDLENKKWK